MAGRVLAQTEADGKGVGVYIAGRYIATILVSSWKDVPKMLRNRLGVCAVSNGTGINRAGPRAWKRQHLMGLVKFTTPYRHYSSVCDIVRIVSWMLRCVTCFGQDHTSKTV